MESQHPHYRRAGRVEIHSQRQFPKLIMAFIFQIILYSLLKRAVCSLCHQSWVTSFPSFAYCLVEMSKRNVFLWNVNYISLKKKGEERSGQNMNSWGVKKRKSNKPSSAAAGQQVAGNRQQLKPFSQATWSLGCLSDPPPPTS